jgi:hypothetical protein
MKLTIDKAAGGAGSRGGHVIGHSKSGRAVYASANHPSHAGFSAQDHHDASSLNMARSKNSGDKSAKNAKFHSAAAAKMSREGGERMSTPSESEHASRSPRGDTRTMTPSESGRLAATPKTQSHPWDKSLKTLSNINKAMEPMITYVKPDMPDSVAISDVNGEPIIPDMGSMDELAQLVSQTYEDADVVAMPDLVNTAAAAPITEDAPGQLEGMAIPEAQLYTFADDTEGTGLPGQVVSFAEDKVEKSAAVHPWLEAARIRMAENARKISVQA